MGGFKFGDAVDTRSNSLAVNYGITVEAATELITQMDIQAAKVKWNVEFYKQNPDILPDDDLVLMPFMVVVGAALRARLQSSLVK